MKTGGVGDNLSPVFGESKANWTALPYISEQEPKQ